MAHPLPGHTEDLLAAVTGLRGGERVVTCSGSCPTAPALDYNPRRMLHMLRLGLGERVQPSQSIWLRTSCSSCTARCPREIKVSDTMPGLCSLVLDRGLALSPSLVTLRDTVTTHYNISGDDKASRLIWSDNLEGEALAFRARRRAEVVFYVGCVASFYPTVYGIP
jgi:Fe-S oxidoreductase